VDVQYFRVWLAHILRLRGADVRRRFRNRLPTAEELDQIALLLALASDARNVSDHVVLLFYHMLSVDRIAARVSPVVDECLKRIGLDLFPRTATDVVRQTMREACRLPRIESRDRSSRRCGPAPRGGPLAEPQPWFCPECPNPPER
jgi:hypothetical protein